MQLGRGFRRLATIVDELEGQDVDVVEATVADDERTAPGTMQVDLRLSVPVSADEATEAGDVSSDTADQTTGQIRSNDVRANGQKSDDSDTARPETDDEPTVDTENAGPGATAQHTESDGQEPAPGDEDVVDGDVIECPFSDCDATFDSEPGMKIHRTKVHLSNGEAATRADSSTPPYRDPDVLAEVYAEHDTFPAMRDALDADVSTQTIRRHMIKHGIHDPDGTDQSDSNEETAADSTATSDSTPDATADEQRDPQEDRLLTDGSSLCDALPPDVDCPDGLTLEELRDSVESADTLYDVQQEFDLDRKTARGVLSSLDLLELVHGRVATRPEREELKTEIDRRIRESIDASA